jgi:hypothetical protein
MQPDQRVLSQQLLLTIPQAARVLGISRAMLYSGRAPLRNIMRRRRTTANENEYTQSGNLLARRRPTIYGVRTCLRNCTEVSERTTACCLDGESRQ